MLKRFLLIATCLLPMLLQAYEEEFLFENEQVRIFKWKLMPMEKIGQHRDDYPQVVIAMQGGTINRIGEDGSLTEVILPAGKAVYQEADLELHDGINASNTAIEAIMIELKTQPSS